MIRGNHHDAWVNGAEDPDLRAGAVLEEARALGELVKQGWKPEAHHHLLRRGTARNPACSARPSGPRSTPRNCSSTPSSTSTPTATAAAIFGIGGSHTLEKFMNGVARDIQDPETKLSVWKRSRLRRHRPRATTAEDRKEIRSRADLRSARSARAPITRLSSTISASPSLNLGFGGEDDGGIYHSIYDDFYWYTHFTDTDFVYGRALAQTSAPP